MIYDISSANERRAYARLNPYSNGIWSTILAVQMKEELMLVLILILMEYDLRWWENQDKKRQSCLNPYSNGIWSTIRKVPTNRCRRWGLVLILILMEYDLRYIWWHFVNRNRTWEVLILILMEYDLRFHQSWRR